VNARRFWIRKDRDNYFLGGVIIACSIGGFVSSYWHFTDRIAVRQNIKLKTQITKEQELKQLRDVQYVPSKQKIGDKQYYRMEGDSRPAVPRPGEDEGD